LVVEKEEGLEELLTIQERNLEIGIIVIVVIEEE